MSCFALGGSLAPAISGVLADPCTTFAAVQKSALCAGNTAVLQRHPFLVPFALLAAAGAMACAVCAVIMQPGASIHAKCEAVLATASSEEQPADGASAPAPNIEAAGPQSALPPAQDSRTVSCKAESSGGDSDTGDESELLGAYRHQNAQFARPKRRTLDAEDHGSIELSTALSTAERAPSARQKLVPFADQDVATPSTSERSADERWSGAWWTHRYSYTSYTRA